MRFINPRYRAALALAASLALAPSVAFAQTEAYEVPSDLGQAAAAAEIADQNEVSGDLLALANDYADGKESSSKAGKSAKTSKTNKAAKTAAGKSAKSAKSAKASASDKDQKRVKVKKKAKTTKTAKVEQSVKKTSTAAKSVKNSQTSKSVNSAKNTKASKVTKSSAERKVLSFDRKLIDQIGTQEATGHTICCPSFSCAYADAVMDGTVHDHEYYTCSCCTWTDWGGGGSSNRCVGTDEELLREAYDQISAGKPTVIHVAGTSGEHWIALIGYKNVKDPDHLTLSNFVALDPWDGAKITASDRYALYGDGCEHITERKVKAAK